jgi:hypothetical protein
MIYLLSVNMKNALKAILVLLLSVFAAGQLFAGVVIKDNSLGATPGFNGIRVVWQTVNETNVARFEIWRASISAQGSVGEFGFAGSVDLHGVGREYDFTDQVPFKATSNLFAYKVRIVFLDGSSADSEVVRTLALSSTAKKTWGSIKAMFR